MCNSSAVRPLGSFRHEENHFDLPEFSKILRLIVFIARLDPPPANFEQGPVRVDQLKYLAFPFSRCAARGFLALYKSIFKQGFDDILSMKTFFISTDISWVEAVVSTFY